MLDEELLLLLLLLELVVLPWVGRRGGGGGGGSRTDCSLHRPSRAVHQVVQGEGVLLFLFQLKVLLFLLPFRGGFLWWRVGGWVGGFSSHRPRPSVVGI